MKKGGGGRLNRPGVGFVGFVGSESEINKSRLNGQTNGTRCQQFNGQWSLKLICARAIIQQFKGTELTARDWTLFSVKNLSLLKMTGPLPPTSIDRVIYVRIREMDNVDGRVFVDGTFENTLNVDCI